MTSSFAVVQFGLIWMRETRCAVEEAANGGKTTEVTNQVFDIIKIIKIIKTSEVTNQVVDFIGILLLLIIIGIIVIFIKHSNTIK